MSRRLPAALALLLLLAVGLAPAASAAPGDVTFAAATPGGTQLLATAVAPSGEVIAVGQSGGAFYAQRYTAAGAPDGAAYHGPAGFAKAVTVQPDGKILVAGFDGNGMRVVRLNADLKPDASFGSGGSATAFQTVSGVGRAIALGPNGTIVVAGSVYQDTRVGVARFSSNGHLDPSLGGNGTVVVDQGPASMANGVAVQPDGKIVIVGQQTPGQPTNGIVLRLDTDGGLDLSFVVNGSRGAYQYRYGSGGYTAFTGVALQTDGKIVISGAEAGGPDALFIRLLPSGSFDTGFGAAHSGVVAFPDADQGAITGGTPMGAYGVGIAGGGRIVGSGVYAHGGTLVEPASWAMTPAGLPDSSYGPGGTILIPPTNREACGMAVGPDGGIVLVGDTVTTYPDQEACAPSSAAGGFVTRLAGYGPPPAGVAGSAPAVSTGAASGISSAAATLHGTVDPGGLATSYRFEYGTTTAYGQSTPAGSLPAGAGPQAVAATVSGLVPNTLYHFRLIATNSAGTTTGGDLTFRTAPGPAVARTDPASAAGQTTATLRGRVDAGGLATVVHFDFGRSSRYGSHTASRTVSASAAGYAVSAGVHGLRPGTTYHYRLVATNAAGTSYGADRTFRTLPHRLGLTAPHLPTKLSTNSLLAGHLTITVSCDRGCRVQLTLLIPLTRSDRRLLGGHAYRLLVLRSSRRTAGTLHLRLRLSKAAQAALGHVRPGQLTLALSGAASGSLASSLTRTLTLG